MADSPEIGAERAATLLTNATGESYRAVGRMRGGETGAHRFIGPAGRPLVIKWDSRPETRPLRGEAVVLSERLRERAGWPVPTTWAIDTREARFVIQEFMPGTPPEHLDHRLVEHLLELHVRRLGLALPDDPSHWPAALIGTLVLGGVGYCRHASLRDHDDRTRSLVERVEAFGSSIDSRDLLGHDIVHWDLHPGNLLIDHGALAAVVDTDFSVVGDAAFDLVILAVTSLTIPCEPGVRTRLFAAAFDELDPLRAQVYLAHLFIRLIDWPIRRGQPNEVEFWLARAEELLEI